VDTLVQANTILRTFQNCPKSRSENNYPAGCADWQRLKPKVEEMLADATGLQNLAVTYSASGVYINSKDLYI
jgi:hypothetical protein